MRNFKDKECQLCSVVFKPTNGRAKYCIDCRATGSKEQDKATYLEKRDQRLATRKEYNHREEVKAIAREYRKDNKEKIVGYFKEYRQLPSSKAAKLYSHTLRKTLKIQATPAWFDKEEVKMIYTIAQERGLEVDHMVPLVSGLVCGLHVQDNLRCIPAALNRHKGNRYWPNMPKEVAA